MVVKRGRVAMMQDGVDWNAAASLTGMASSECRRYHVLQPAVTSPHLLGSGWRRQSEIQRGIRCLLARRSGQHIAWWRDGGRRFMHGTGMSESVARMKKRLEGRRRRECWCWSVTASRISNTAP